MKDHTSKFKRMAAAAAQGLPHLHIQEMGKGYFEILVIGDQEWAMQVLTAVLAGMRDDPDINGKIKSIDVEVTNKEQKIPPV